MGWQLFRERVILREQLRRVFQQCQIMDRQGDVLKRIHVDKCIEDQSFSIQHVHNLEQPGINNKMNEAIFFTLHYFVNVYKRTEKFSYVSAHSSIKK